MVAATAQRIILQDPVSAQVSLLMGISDFPEYKVGENDPAYRRRVMEHFEETRDRLTSLEHAIFGGAPIRVDLNPREREVHKRALHLCARGYPDKQRKLLKRKYLDHPMKVERRVLWGISMANIARITMPERCDERTDPLGKLNALDYAVAAAFHDLVEERTQVRNKKERESIVDSVFEFLIEKTKEPEHKGVRIHQRDIKLYKLLTAAGKDIGGIGLERHVDQLGVYEADYRSNLLGKTHRAKFERLLKEEGYTSVEWNLNRFFRILPEITPVLEHDIVERELEIQEEETGKLEQEYRMYLDDVNYDRKEEHIEFVITKTKEMTRYADELYYAACGKADSVLKAADRCENIFDLDYRERKGNIRFFRYRPESDRVDWSAFYENAPDEDEKKRNWAEKKRTEARKMLDVDGNLDLISLLDIPEEYWDTDGMRILDRAVEDIIRKNHKEHLKEDRHYSRERTQHGISYAIRVQDRFFHWFKTFIHFTVDRQKEIVPLEARILQKETNEGVYESAVSNLEGTASCHGIRTLKIRRMREIYRDIKAYAQTEWFDKVTEPIDSPNGGLKLDGFLTDYIDLRVRGRKAATRTISNEKGKMFATSLIAIYLTQRFRDPLYFTQGLNRHGLTPVKRVA